MNLGYRIAAFFVVALLGPAVLAESFLAQQPDFTREGEIVITEDDVYRFVRTRLEFDILTARITYRAALKKESQMEIYEDYILGAEQMFRRNDLTKTHFNDILLAIEHVPAIAQVAVEAFQSMPPDLVALAEPINTFEQLQALMDGYVAYDIMPEDVPWLISQEGSETAPQKRPRIPEALQGFPDPKALFPNMETPE